MAIRNGTSGNDTLVGTNPSSKLYAYFYAYFSGADTIYGNDGNDSLSGLGGDDDLNGGDGNDLLFGGTGNDSLQGGTGHDTLTGGSGRDALNGGEGNDTFVYKSFRDSLAGEEQDVIWDFYGNGAAIGDRIDLKAIDANAVTSGDQAFTWKGSPSEGAGTLWYKPSAAGIGGVLNGNIDNDPAVEFQIYLPYAPAVHVTDILL